MASSAWPAAGETASALPRRVLITGANRGLGLGLVRHYLAGGWWVTACTRAPDEAGALADLQASSAEQLTIHALDVTDDASVVRLAKALAGQPIDILLNVAGYFGAIPLDQPGGITTFGRSDFEDWEKLFRINTIGVMRLCEALVDNVAASSERKIVAISSSQGSIGGNTVGKLYGYRASKAALNALIKAMAIDLAPRGITTEAIHPGWVKSDMGGPGALVEVAESAAGVAACIARLTPETTGSFVDFQGRAMPW